MATTVGKVASAPFKGAYKVATAPFKGTYKVASAGLKASLWTDGKIDRIRRAGLGAAIHRGIERRTKKYVDPHDSYKKIEEAEKRAKEEAKKEAEKRGERKKRRG